MDPKTTRPTEIDVTVYVQVWAAGSVKWEMQHTQLVRDNWHDQEAGGFRGTYWVWLPIADVTDSNDLPNASRYIVSETVTDIL